MKNDSTGDAQVLIAVAPPSEPPIPASGISENILILNFNVSSPSTFCILFNSLLVRDTAEEVPVGIAGDNCVDVFPPVPAPMVDVQLDLFQTGLFEAQLGYISTVSCFFQISEIRTRFCSRLATIPSFSLLSPRIPLQYKLRHIYVSILKELSLEFQCKGLVEIGVLYTLTWRCTLFLHSLFAPSD